MIGGNDHKALPEIEEQMKFVKGIFDSLRDNGKSEIDIEQRHMIEAILTTLCAMRLLTKIEKWDSQ